MNVSGMTEWTTGTASRPNSWTRHKFSSTKIELFALSTVTATQYPPLPHKSHTGEQYLQ